MVETINGVEYYLKEEFADLLRVPPRTVENWIEEGLIKVWQIRPGRTVRIPASELERHLHPKK